jgi:hypothetical protein
MEDIFSEPLADHESASSFVYRFLQEKKKDDPRIDCSVSSVGVMTLGLILVVELLRHRIEHTAAGKPFFQAVLEGVYSECKFARSLARSHSKTNRPSQSLYGTFIMIYHIKSWLLLCTHSQLQPSPGLVFLLLLLSNYLGFVDSHGDGCEWYEQYQQVGYASAGTIPGTCGEIPCTAKEACCGDGIPPTVAPTRAQSMPLPSPDLLVSVAPISGPSGF